MLTIKMLPIADLKPAPYNPRVRLTPGMPAYERLARSLREFDLVQPVVWNERTGHVVSGHQRLEVLRHEGATDMPAVVVSLPLAREKALNVALNNPRVGGAWDAGKLVDLIAELKDLPDVDVTLTGFDAEEIRDLVLAPVEPPAPHEPNDHDGLIRVTIEFPPDQWDALRPELDRWIADRQLRVSVRGIPAMRTQCN